MTRQTDQHTVSPGDGELVERARQGDREAFRVLVERYQRKVAAMALGMLRNREDALDVVQDTFTKAYQSLDKFKGDSSFYTWIYRIGVNLCIDHQRRESRYVPLAVDSEDSRRSRPPTAEGSSEINPTTTRSARLGGRLVKRRGIDPEHRAVAFSAKWTDFAVRNQPSSRVPEGTKRETDSTTHAVCFRRGCGYATR
jgi:RNA polymerase sigma factor (sigma-70 family)